jgi:hypothetical protein
MLKEYLSRSIHSNKTHYFLLCKRPKGIFAREWGMSDKVKIVHDTAVLRNRDAQGGGLIGWTRPILVRNRHIFDENIWAIILIGKDHGLITDTG